MMDWILYIIVICGGWFILWRIGKFLFGGTSAQTTTRAATRTTTRAATHTTKNADEYQAILPPARRNSPLVDNSQYSDGMTWDDIHLPVTVSKIRQVLAHPGITYDACEKMYWSAINSDEIGRTHPVIDEIAAVQSKLLDK